MNEDEYLYHSFIQKRARVGAMSEALVNEIVTAYGIQPFHVERLVDQYGEKYVAAALGEVRALLTEPESPFGWMVSQLRSGRIQAEQASASKNAAQTSGFAARYCAGFHGHPRNVYLEAICAVCGRPA
jgi:hypothetical protein